MIWHKVPEKAGNWTYPKIKNKPLCFTKKIHKEQQMYYFLVCFIYIKYIVRRYFILFDNLPQRVISKGRSL